MKKVLRFVAICTLTSLAVACGSKEKTEEAATTAETAATTAEPATTTEAPAAPDAAAAPTDAAFDINSVPVSTANLGRFPYVSGLKGYHFNVPNDSAYYEFDRSYVYDGKQLVPIEGKVLRREYTVMNNDKKTSELMQQRNYESLIKSLGGVQVSSAELPYDAVEKIGREKYNKNNGNIDPEDQVDTYLIRQKDKEIWIQLMPNESYPKLNVTERAAMPQQVGVIKADELKKN